MKLKFYAFVPKLARYQSKFEPYFGAIFALNGGLRMRVGKFLVLTGSNWLVWFELVWTGYFWLQLDLVWTLEFSYWYTNN